MRAAQIGLGRIGLSLERDPLRYKPCTHLGTILALQKRNKPIKIIGLCDHNESHLNSAQELVKEQGHIFFSREYQKMIELKPDLLIIAVTSSDHFQILKETIASGIPKVLVEKPLVVSKYQLRKIKKFYWRHQSMIWVNYERRFHAKYRQLKQDIQRNRFGKILSYRGLLICYGSNFYPNKTNEGILLHDTTHLLDLALYLFGEVERTKVQYSNDRVHTIFLEHKRDQLEGNIFTVRHPRLFQFELELIFENVRIITGNDFMKVENIKKSKNYKGFYSLDHSVPRLETKPTFNQNPFITLYNEMISNQKFQDNFDDSCKNIEILLKK